MRKGKVFILAGARGSGKTTVMQDFLEKSKLPKKLVLDTYHHPMYKDWPAMKIDFFETHESWTSGKFHFHDIDTDKMLEIVSLKINNTVIVFEDAAKFINQSVQKSVKRISLDSKNIGNDVFFLYHTLAEVPQDLFRWADYLILFKTQEVITNQKSRIGAYPRIEPHFLELEKSPNKYINILIPLASD